MVLMPIALIARRPHDCAFVRILTRFTGFRSGDWPSSLFSNLESQVVRFSSPASLPTLFGDLISFITFVICKLASVVIILFNF